MAHKAPHCAVAYTIIQNTPQYFFSVEPERGVERTDYIIHHLAILSTNTVFLMVTISLWW